MKNLLRSLLPLSLRERVSRITGRHPDQLLSVSDRRAKYAKQKCQKGEFVVLATTPAGKLWVDLRDYGVGYPLFVRQEYEPVETSFIQRFLRKGDVYVDVGANLGYFVCLAASVVGPSGHIVGFEPEPHNYELLSRNAAIAPRARIQCINLGLGERSSRMFLAKSDYNFGDHRISTSEANSLSQVPVEITTLDEKSAELGLHRIDLVKIDTQGFEVQVLRGMEQTLRRANAPAVMMEFWPFGIERQGCSAAEVFNIVQNLDMRVYHLDTTPIELATAEEAISLAQDASTDDLGRYVNLAIVPAHRHEDLQRAVAEVRVPA